MTENESRMSKKYSREGFRPAYMNSGDSSNSSKITSKYSVKYELNPPSLATVGVSEFKGKVYIHFGNFNKNRNKGGQSSVSYRDYEFDDIANFISVLKKDIRKAQIVAKDSEAQYKEEEPRFIPRFVVKKSRRQDSGTDAEEEDESGEKEKDGDSGTGSDDSGNDETGEKQRTLQKKKRKANKPGKQQQQQQPPRKKHRGHKQEGSSDDSQ